MKLRNLQFIPFSSNEIQVQGWLKKQLEIQAQGLSGNLDKVWPDVRDSSWIGGDREGWERVPYWLDGFIPLAYLLHDSDLIQRAQKYVDAILSRQQSDGWICPCSEEERPHYDIWAAFLIGKVLCLYADCSHDSRIQPALTRMFRQLSRHIDSFTLFNWASSRWFEALIPIFWLYERQPEDWLLELAYKLQVQGVDWSQVIHSGIIKNKSKNEWNFLSHVVNLSMMLKYQALMSRITGEDPNVFAQEALSQLEEYHGMAVGYYTGDECLAGNSPIQGSELCGVVEAMFSFEQLFAVSGNPEWADRLEKLAFNAFPATTSPDMWSHQYDQMTNQVQCAPMEEGHVIFGTNSAESNLFGLEPNYGCCTANFNQGWPKLALSTFFKSENKKGIASVVLAPSEVNTVIDGVGVSCRLETGYPFRNDLTYTITTDKPIDFTLYCRIPSFVTSATVDGKAVPKGKFAEITKTWNGTETVSIQFEMTPTFADRPNNMVCLWRGPLLYSVAIRERWEKKEYESNGVVRKYPYCDYCIYPESKWNYAFAGDEFQVEEHPFEAAFQTSAPPISLTAQMAEIPWGFHYGTCDAQPESRQPIGNPESIKLIPYGCTNLRMTEMPKIK